MLCQVFGRAPADLHVQFRSRRLNMTTSLLVSKETYHLIYKAGGIDSFLIQTGGDKLTKKARRLRSAILGYI